MKKSGLINLKKDTDSPSLHKGILFQYLVTLDKWLDICEKRDFKTSIFCEREDDIFIINNSNKSYTFVQVKCYTEKFSFNSIEIKKTLYNFLSLDLKYTNRDCIYIFETNTNPKPRAGKILIEWVNRNNKSKSINKEIIEKTQELLEKHITKDIKLQPKKKLVLINHLKSKNYLKFLSKIRWIFCNKAQDDAIEYYERIIIDKISKHTDGKENILLARLLSEVLHKSSENEKHKRKLSLNLFNEIKNETCTQIQNNTDSRIKLIVDQNFELLKKVSQIETTVKEFQRTFEKEFKDNFSFESFMTQYKQSTIRELSRVNFIGLKMPSGIRHNDHLSLKEIYIEPKVKITNEKECNYRDIFNLSNKMIILGGPGTGKSLLIKSIICELFSDPNEHVFHKELYYHIPFRIELRRYLAWKKNTNTTFIDYITFKLKESYINDVTNKHLTSILNNHPSILFFDGLDEIFEPKDKEIIVTEIMNFSSKFSQAKILITSRIVGYDDIKLSSDFKELFIQEFDNNQIKNYIARWYEYYLSGIENKEFRNKETNTCHHQILELQDELKRNPLLLSLIVIIFSSVKEIPKSKLQIYESCTNTVIDEWDSKKQDMLVSIDPELIRYKTTLFAELAYWEYERSSSKSRFSITQSQVIEFLSDIIISKIKLSDDFLIAKKHAEDFLMYAEKRSLYFDNEFTHKTFREYFTALWIYMNFEKKHKMEKRNEIILKYMDNSYWIVVLELLISMIDNNQADNEVMSSLLESIKINKKAYRFISHILPHIKFIDKSLREQLIIESIELSIKSASEITSNNQANESLFSSDLFFNIKKIFRVNYKTIDFNLFFDNLLDKYYDNEELITKLFIFYYELYIFCGLDRQIVLENSICLNKHKDLILKYANKNTTLFWLVRLLEDKAEMEDYLLSIDLFGKNCFFMRVPLYYENMATFTEKSIMLSIYLTSFENLKNITNNVKLLCERKISILDFTDAINIRILRKNEIFEISRLISEIEDTEIKGYLLFNLIPVYTISDGNDYSAILKQIERNEFYDLIQQLLLNNDYYDIKKKAIFNFLGIKRPVHNNRI